MFYYYKRRWFRTRKEVQETEPQNVKPVQRFAQMHNSSTVDQDIAYRIARVLWHYVARQKGPTPMPQHLQQAHDNPPDTPEPTVQAVHELRVLLAPWLDKFTHRRWLIRAGVARV
jgi:hypothetical protein